MQHFTRVLVVSGVVALANASGSVQGEERALLAASEGSAPTKLVVQANNDFAFALYQQLAGEESGNLVLSPYSISTAVAMVAEGARGETAREIGSVLRFPQAARRLGPDAQQIPWQTSLMHTGMSELQERFNPADDPQTAKLRERIAALRGQLQAANLTVRLTNSDRAVRAARRIANELNELLPQVDQYELTVANAIWAEQTYPLDAEFVQTMKRYYASGGVFPADFVNGREREAGRINAWIEEHTGGRIQGAIDPDTLNPLTRMILANAIYFRGEWSEPFRERSTRPRDFVLANGETVSAPMMYDRKSAARYGAFRGDGSLFPTPTKVLASGKDEMSRYPASDGHLMLELPYKGDAISMVLLAPQRADGLADLEKRLTSASVARWLDQLAARQVRVYLPKFTLEASYRLGSTLRQMGMVRAFVSPQLPRGADFRGMSASSDPEQMLYLSQVLHKAVIEVHEKGTVAAAVTVIGVDAGAAPAEEMIPFTPTFAADRPFLLLILDRKSGTVLFLGRVTDPT